MSKKPSAPKDPPIRTIVILASKNFKSIRDRLTGISNRLAREPNLHIVNLYNVQRFPREMTRADAIICTSETTPLRRRFSPQTKFFNFESPLVHIDTPAIAQAAADLLIRRGYKDFAFIETNLPSEHPYSRARALAFRAYLRKQGLSCRIYTPRAIKERVTADDTQDVAKFLTDLPKPCGVMLYADNRAQTVLNACHQAHLSVPGQISLVGVDNDDLICENTRPTLSSVLPDFELAGELLADAIMRRLNGEKHIAPSIYGVKAVFERSSSQDLRWGGLLVSRLDDYLTRNFASPFSIGRMVRQFNISRRYAEFRFKEIKGCTIHERLEALRIDRARQLLKKTALPVAEIAEACGYRSDRAFRYAFTAALGVSPRQFRN